MTEATNDPKEVAGDFGRGVGGVVLQHAAGGLVRKAGSTEVDKAKADLSRKGSVKGKAKAAETLKKAEQKVDKKAEKVSEAAGAVKDLHDEAKKDKEKKH
jgi:hypothetical protein